MYSGHGGNLSEVQEKYGWCSEEVIDFSTNVNPLGIPPSALKAFENSFKEVGAYPDSQSRTLLRKASAHYALSSTEILAGNGTTEFIFLIPRVFPVSSVLIFSPTYSDYETSAKLAGCQVHFGGSNLRPSIHDFHSILLEHRGKVKLVFLCNPNNPTGVCFSAEQVRWLIQRHPSFLFVVDEAYIDFVNAPAASLLNFPLEKNVIVLKSLTKIFNIPGLRLGFAFASEALIQKLEHFKEPWTVNTPAQKVGEALLDEKSFLDETRIFVEKSKAGLFHLLNQFKELEPFTSEANYFLIRLVGELKAEALKRDLLKEKILIRSCHQWRGLGPDFFRIAVKKEEDHHRLFAVLRQKIK
ncbi:MAG: threonine-phosphate decarboxylase [Nitrospirae bacterium]|nr:threonine-phosphate decarboxylase [Nitrospirota bacterium]MBI3352742.1 threonine-phosphate decarboxylase [Nitrospirota bacterium]